MVLNFKCILVFNVPNMIENYTSKKEETIVNPVWGIEVNGVIICKGSVYSIPDSFAGSFILKWLYSCLRFKITQLLMYPLLLYLYSLLMVLKTFEVSLVYSLSHDNVLDLTYFFLFQFPVYINNVWIKFF